MKLLPDHINDIMVWWKFYYKLILDIIVNDSTQQKWYWNLNTYV